MKPKEYTALISRYATDKEGFVPMPVMRWFIRTTPRNTAREEAIVASVTQQANPRKPISGSYGWGPEEQMVLRQLWAKPGFSHKWKDVPVHGADKLVSDQGGLPVPNALSEPGIKPMDIEQKIRSVLDVPRCAICDMPADICGCETTDQDE